MPLKDMCQYKICFNTAEGLEIDGLDFLRNATRDVALQVQRALIAESEKEMKRALFR